MNQVHLQETLGIFLPSILSTDAVTILWMLWEGDVDANEWRPILQSYTASNHRNPAKTKTKKTGIRELEKKERKDSHLICKCTIMCISIYFLRSIQNKPPR